MTTWRTTRDVRLDILVADLLGKTGDGAVEAVLAANPGLAALGPVIPLGTDIVVPELPAATATVGVRLWE